MTEIIHYDPAPITTAAQSDDMLVQLFITTKRSEKTRVQYSHSTAMLLGFTGKPLQAITLQDALAITNGSRRSTAACTASNCM